MPVVFNSISDFVFIQFNRILNNYSTTYYWCKPGQVTTCISFSQGKVFIYKREIIMATKALTNTAYYVSVAIRSILWCPKHIFSNICSHVNPNNSMAKSLLSPPNYKWGKGGIKSPDGLESRTHTLHH